MRLVRLRCLHSSSWQSSPAGPGPGRGRRQNRRRPRRVRNSVSVHSGGCRLPRKLIANGFSMMVNFQGRSGGWRGSRVGDGTMRQTAVRDCVLPDSTRPASSSRHPHQVITFLWWELRFIGGDNFVSATANC